MRYQLIFITLFLLVLINSQEKDVLYSEDYMISTAEYVVNELKKLSDSGIYKLLEIKKIHNYEKTSGIYHYNTAMSIELSSPYFESNKSSEIFNFVLMEHKIDKVKSFAVDEFPIMKGEFIEQFSLEKISRKKTEREEAFRRLEIEALVLGENPSYASAEYMALKEKLDKRKLADLLGDLDDADVQSHRAENSLLIQKHIGPELVLSEERAVGTMSLKELYAITTDAQTASDYQRQRASSLVDLSLAYLQSQLQYSGDDSPE